jgi:hypothetical protein
MFRSDIKARIEELQTGNNRKSILSRNQALQLLADMAINEDRAVDRLAAIVQLSRMNGWNEPEKFQVGVEDTLRSYLLELRRQPIAWLPATHNPKPVSGPVLPLTFDIKRPSPGADAEESH